ncbi:protein kinase [Sorangium sp. So ce291]|uniref:serine/threonine-protein kinase n=1 Tax=Sorangium sp. So ce291 TaxID=3133294 RepID=UPI003F606F68
MSDVIEAYKLLPGMLLARKYRLSRKIGQGAMGVVWAASNEATGREVALKVIARPDPSLRKRLLREAQSCGALQHPNIVDVIDVARTESGEPCMIMELLVGESVAALLEARRRLDAPLAARIAHDVAGALAAAHAVQIVHRDLKPANLFLHRPPEASDFVVKVLDFGVAKNLADARGVTSTLDAAVGSPFYMSPEQVRADRDVDPRADLWALGVVLFEMLTGVRPFQGEGPQLLSQILEGEIPKVSRYVRRVDERLVRIVDRCLRRERGERFASAEEVAGELAAFVVRGAGEAGALREGRGGDGAVEAERRELWTTGERAALGVGARAEQETVVAPGQSRAVTAEEIATTVPVGRPGEGNGGVQTAAGQGGQAGQGLQGASAVSGWRAGGAVGAVSSVWGQGAGGPVHGASGAGVTTGGPVAGGPSRGASNTGGPGAGVPVSGASSAGVPAEAPVAGVKPVVTLRGTVVMQGQVAEAQRQAAMAMMDAARAQAQAQAQRAGARGAIARAAAEVGTSGGARRRRGGSRAVVVALAAVLLVGVLAAAWFVSWGKRPASPAGADGGSVPATGAAQASPRDVREVERAAATATAGAMAVPEQPAGTGAPAAVGHPGSKSADAGGQGERGAKAGQAARVPGAATQVPQAPPLEGVRSPGLAAAATAGPVSLPSHAPGTGATAGDRMSRSGGVSGPANKPSPADEVYGAPSRSTAPAARGASPGEMPAPERKSPAPPRPF